MRIIEDDSEFCRTSTRQATAKAEAFGAKRSKLSGAIGQLAGSLQAVMYTLKLSQLFAAAAGRYYSKPMNGTRQQQPQSKIQHATTRLEQEVEVRKRRKEKK